LAAFMLPPYRMHTRGVVVAAFKLRAQHRMHRLRLLGRRRLAGADGPDGLVGHDDFADAVAVDV
jgi:hypothetical protein